MRDLTGAERRPLLAPCLRRLCRPQTRQEEAWVEARALKSGNLQSPGRATAEALRWIGAPITALKLELQLANPRLAQRVNEWDSDELAPKWAAAAASLHRGDRVMASLLERRRAIRKRADQLLKQVRLTKIRVQTEQGCTQPNWCMGIHSWVNRRAHVRVHECI